MFVAKLIELSLNSHGIWHANIECDEYNFINNRKRWVPSNNDSGTHKDFQRCYVCGYRFLIRCTAYTLKLSCTHNENGQTKKKWRLCHSSSRFELSTKWERPFLAGCSYDFVVVLFEFLEQKWRISSNTYTYTLYNNRQISRSFFVQLHFGPRLSWSFNLKNIYTQFISTSQKMSEINRPNTSSK